MDGQISLEEALEEEDRVRFQNHVRKEEFRRSFLFEKMKACKNADDKYPLFYAATHEKFWASTGCDEYMEDLFGSEYVFDRERVMVRRGTRTDSMLLEDFVEPDKRNAMLEKFYITDLTFTPDTYSPTGKRTCSCSAHNRYSMRAWGVDISYRDNPDYKDIEAKDFFYMLMADEEDLFPLPNYVEYSHGLRLIYTLPEKINCKYGKSLIRAIRRIEMRICNLLNGKYRCFADPQKQWYRVPGSIDRRGQETVVVEAFSEYPLSVQSILTDWMPALPMGRKEYLKAKNLKKKEAAKEKEAAENAETPKEKRSAAHKAPNSGQKHNFIQTLSEWRIDDYEVVAQQCPDVPRERLLFLYGVASTWLDRSFADNAIKNLKVFNKKLMTPLDEDEIESKFQNFKENFELKRYRFKNSTIMSMLGLTDDNCEYLGLHLRTEKKTAEKLRLIREGKTRQQKAKRRRETILPLFEEGLSSRQIAERVDYCLRTVQYELHAIKEERKAAAEKAAAEEAVRAAEAAEKAKAAASKTPEELRLEALRQSLREKLVAACADEDEDSSKAAGSTLPDSRCGKYTLERQAFVDKLNGFLALFGNKYTPRAA